MGFAAQERRHTLYGLAAFLSLTALVLFTLWRFPPELYSFYPACPVHTYLHFECPGCGSTRALSALLHGRFAEALRLNALFVVLVLPLSATYTFVACTRAFRSGVFCWPVIPQAATWTVLVCASAFTVLRNI